MCWTDKGLENQYKTVNTTGRKYNMYGTTDCKTSDDLPFPYGGVMNNAVYKIIYSIRLVGCYKDKPARAFPILVGEFNDMK
jgi:hypothetical protein